MTGRTRPYQTLPGDKYVCTRCGIVRGVPRNRARPEGMCADCVSVTREPRLPRTWASYTPEQRARANAARRERRLATQEGAL